MSTDLIPGELLQSFTTVVDPSARVVGTFSSADDSCIRIDGRFRGNITLGPSGVVAISDGGVVEDAHVEADYILISGYFTGTAHARLSLVVTEKADVRGELRYSSTLRVHQAARVRASIAPSKIDVDAALLDSN